MRRIGELIRAGYPLAALSTGTPGFYQTLGWERWRGPTCVDGPNGRECTPADDGDVMILRTPRAPRLDLDGDIVCDWRMGERLVARRDKRALDLEALTASPTAHRHMLDSYGLAVLASQR